MPRRLRVRFPFSGYTLQAGRGEFVLSGQDAFSRLTTPADTQEVSRLNVSERMSDLNWVSECLRARWTNVGGDWRDGSDVAQGTSDFARVTLTTGAGWRTFAGGGMAALVTRLLSSNTGIHLRKTTSFVSPVITARTGVNKPVLTVTTTTGTFTPTLLHTRSLVNESGFRTPSLLKFDMSTVTGTVTSATLAIYVETVNQTGTLAVNWLDTPKVLDYPFVGVTTTAPSVLEREMVEGIDSATYFDERRNTTVAATYGEDPAYLVKYRRSAYTTSGPLNMRWDNKPLTSYGVGSDVRELYMAWANYIEPEQWDYQHGEGNKLSGFEGNVSGGSWYCTLWHQLNLSDIVTKDVANPYLWGLSYYARLNGIQPSDGGTTTTAFAFLRPSRWYHFEMRVKLNSALNLDGEIEFWLNGHRIFSRTGVRFHPTEVSVFDMCQWQLYAGGPLTHTPYANYWWRSAKFQVSRSRIGVPAGFLSDVFPAWRRGMSVDTLHEIDGTADMATAAGTSVTLLGNGSVQQHRVINDWNGIAAGPQKWWVAANGGHDQGNNVNWENKVYAIDFSQDTPRWALDHPGSPYANVTAYAPTYTDGLPPSRHSYYAPQYIDERGRVFLVTISAPYGEGFPPAEDGTLAYSGAKPDTWAFDVTTKTWDAWGAYPVSGWSQYDLNLLAYGQVPSVCKDPNSSMVYVGSRDNTFYSYNAATNVWTKMAVLDPNGVSFVGSSTLAFLFHPTLIDVNRNRWVSFKGLSVRFIDLVTNKFYTTTGGAGEVTGAMAATAGLGNYGGVVHDRDNDRYLAVVGAELFAINPTTLVTTKVCDVPAAHFQGLNGRLHWHDQLGCVMYLPAYNYNIQFIPTR